MFQGRVEQKSEANDNRKKFDSGNKVENHIELTYFSIPCNEPDIASGFSCLSHRRASSQAPWLRIGVHDESIRLCRPC